MSSVLPLFRVWMVKHFCRLSYFQYGGLEETSLLFADDNFSFASCLLVTTLIGPLTYTCTICQVSMWWASALPVQDLVLFMTGTTEKHLATHLAIKILWPGIMGNKIGETCSLISITPTLSNHVCLHKQIIASFSDCVRLAPNSEQQFKKMCSAGFTYLTA